MEDAQNGQDGQVDDVGMSEESKGEQPAPEASEDGEGSQSQMSLSVQKRLKAQKRSHDRVVRELQSRISELESSRTQPNESMDNYNAPQGGVDEQIHKAVSYALQHKEMQERKAHEAQQAAHVQRQYGELQKHLDKMGDKYDDFHDVVFGSDTPYTTAMRDYSLTLPRSGSGSAGEVLYKLGKNPDELNRIAKLHPLDQASEMARLSHALISGGDSKESQSRSPLGNIKSNPVSNSHSINEKTPVGELRRRMKAGWK